MTLANVLEGQVLGIFTDKTAIVGFEDTVDVFTDENHNIKIAKTSHPIETGATISDNAVIMPRKLRLQGYVSNIDQVLLVGLPSPQRGIDAWSRIVALAESLQPVDILTTLELLEGYLITGLTANSNVSTGTALEFTMELEELQFANSEIVTLPADTLEGGPAENKAGTVEGGNKQSVEATPEQNESLLSRILGGL